MHTVECSMWFKVIQNGYNTVNDTEQLQLKHVCIKKKRLIAVQNLFPNILSYRIGFFNWQLDFIEIPLNKETIESRRLESEAWIQQFHIVHVRIQWHGTRHPPSSRSWVSPDWQSVIADRNLRLHCVCIPSKPYRNYILSGDMFAISKQFFEELKFYDAGMRVWGGEQFELRLVFISSWYWICIENWPLENQTKFQGLDVWRRTFKDSMF